jgi:hypothetical protein
MKEIEEVYGIPKVLDFNEELYQKNLKEHDFSEKLVDGRSEEDKESE